MKKVWQWWKAGAIALVPIVVTYWICEFIVSWLFSTGSSFGFTDSNLLNVTIFTFLLFVTPLVVRFLLHFRFVRSIGFTLTGWIPFVGTMFKFFFQTDSDERIREDSMQEVEFYLGSSVKMFGIVVNEMMERDSSQLGDPLVPWLLVILPTTPGAITGPIIKIKKSDAIYTGRTAKDTVVTAASFGLIYDEAKSAQQVKTPRS